MDCNGAAWTWKWIAAYGFVLNALWEFAQCTILYDMWAWGFWRATAWMWGAIFGDVLIVLGLIYLARLLAGRPHMAKPDGAGWLSLLTVSFAAAVALEWAAQEVGLWDYTKWMPGFPVFGREVGLAPVVQVTILPALSLLLARRSSSQVRGPGG